MDGVVGGLEIRSTWVAIMRDDHTSCENGYCVGALEDTGGFFELTPMLLLNSLLSF
jgi:hypothetical protein